MSMFRGFITGCLVGGFTVWWLMTRPPTDTFSSSPPAVEKLVNETSSFVAYWENKPLALGLVEHANGQFHGTDPLAAAQACDTKPDGCHEGITIGFGYNMAAHNAVQFMDDLVPVVGRERAKAMLFCVGLKGVSAYNRCHNHSALTLNRDEAYALLKVRVERDVTAVLRKAKQEDVTLTEGQGVALGSLHYNLPSLVQRAPKLWAALRAGNIDSARAEIAFNSGSQKNPSLQPRRDAEAQKFAKGYWLAFM